MPIVQFSFEKLYNTLPKRHASAGNPSGSCLVSREKSNEATVFLFSKCDKVIIKATVFQSQDLLTVFFL